MGGPKVGGGKGLSPPIRGAVVAPQPMDYVSRKGAHSLPHCMDQFAGQQLDLKLNQCGMTAGAEQAHCSLMVGR